ncbi:MAG: hypothetical protein C5B59_06550 [Bacteroidetes bacterium]|nr:MAG: hypothetical protein C5B59_06550 [Bacteroidota bacterium]
MAYRLNRKNLAVTRVLPKGQLDGAKKRLQYMHVSRQGTTATDGFMVARVSLATEEGQPLSPVIYPKDVINKIGTVDWDETVSMPAGLTSQTTAEHAVPNFDAIIPSPKEQVAEFTCDAEQLMTLLKVALDVSEDSDHCVRLRICDSPALGKVLRIDSLAFPPHQSFCGVLKGVQYEGKHIAGDKGDDISTAPADETINQTPLPLKLEGGRKFRG